MMAKQQHQRTAAMLQQVQQQAYQAQQNAQMTQFKAQAMKQQQMFAKQAAAATASYAPNMNSSMNGSMGMMGGNRWNKLRANGTFKNIKVGRISFYTFIIGCNYRYKIVFIKCIPLLMFILCKSYLSKLTQTVYANFAILSLLFVYLLISCLLSSLFFSPIFYRYCNESITSYDGKNLRNEW